MVYCMPLTSKITLHILQMIFKSQFLEFFSTNCFLNIGLSLRGRWGWYMMYSMWGTIMFCTIIHSPYMACWHHIHCTVILNFGMGFTRYKFPPHHFMLQLWQRLDNCLLGVVAHKAASLTTTSIAMSYGQSELNMVGLLSCSLCVPPLDFPIQQLLTHLDCYQFSAFPLS
jgi:hypothetical protein